MLSILRFTDLFERKYIEFIRHRIKILDIDNQYKQGGQDITGILYDEDVMFLTKPYHDCYNDSDENQFSNKSLAIDGIIGLLNFFREQCNNLTFDFHSCFYYEPCNLVQKFVSHKPEYLKEQSLKEGC